MKLEDIEANNMNNVPSSMVNPLENQFQQPQLVKEANMFRKIEKQDQFDMFKTDRENGNDDEIIDKIEVNLDANLNDYSEKKQNYKRQMYESNREIQIPKKNVPDTYQNLQKNFQTKSNFIEEETEKDLQAVKKIDPLEENDLQIKNAKKALVSIKITMFIFIFIMISAIIFLVIYLTKMNV